MSQDEYIKNERHIINFQTPYKSNNSMLNGNYSNLNHEWSAKYFLDQNSSEGNRNRRMQNSGFRCTKKDCKCLQMDEILRGLIYSPSSNYLFQSPSSLEKYMESFSRERINVLKLIKAKNLEDIGELDKENSDPNIDNNFINYINDSENFSIVNSSKKKSSSDSLNKNNFNECKFNKISPISSNHENLIFSDEKIRAKKNLMNEFQDFQLGNNKKRERDLNSKDTSEIKNLASTAVKKSLSFKDMILNSPAKPFASDSKSNIRRQIFLCSDSKITNRSELGSAAKSGISISNISEHDATFFSSEKKKRFRKSTNQLNLLKITYKENGNKDWTKEMITEISNKIGLPENKVYKWLWDRKNKEYKEKKRFIVHNIKNQER